MLEINSLHTPGHGLHPPVFSSHRLLLLMFLFQQDFAVIVI